MKLKRDTILELGKILQEDYNVNLEAKNLEKFAYSFVGYFDLLERVENRHRFQNSSHRAIDISGDSVLDKEEVK